MMLKGSSSTLLCALVGLTVLLCVVNEAQGFKCHINKVDEKGFMDFKAFKEADCIDSNVTKICKNEDGGKDACFKWTNHGEGGGFKKGCTCSTADTDVCTNGKVTGVYCFCHKESCNGATTRTLAFSTLLSVSALAIITSAYWTLF